MPEHQRPQLERVEVTGLCRFEGQSIVIGHTVRCMEHAEEISRQQLADLLAVSDARMQFDEVLRDFPPEHYNTRPPNVAYTFWQVLEHVRFCQWDLIDYVVNPSYQAVDFPSGVWPAPNAIADEERWQATISGFHADIARMVAYLADPEFPLFVTPSWAWEPQHSPYRSFLVALDHNASHLGEIGILRQVMGLWTTTEKGHFG
jgi:hypothetical protein